MMKLALRDDRAPSETNPSGNPRQGRVRSRPLLLLERTMYRDGRTPFTSVFSLKLRGPLNECQLRIALRRLQDKHPLLRCVVDDTRDWPHFVLLDDPLPLQLRIVDRLSEDHWEAETRREWVTPFNGAAEPLARLTWLRGSGIHNLILSGHHCICDGQAGITLLHDLLRACNDPECDMDSCHEFGGLEDIVPPAVMEDPRFHRRLRWRRHAFEWILWWNNRHYTKPSPIDKETLYSHRRILSREITLSIVERSRTENITLLAPVALAFMQAFRDVRGTRAFRKVNAMVNARRFLVRIRPDALFGLAPGVGLNVKDLPAPSNTALNTFWKRARAIKTDLDKRVSDLGAVFFQYLLSLERLHGRYHSVVNFFEQAPVIRNLTFSNMGRLALAAQYGDLSIEKVYSPLVMVSPTPANTVVFSSFGGEMEFAIISDEQSLPRADAVAISQRAADILQACITGSI